MKALVLGILGLGVAGNAGASSASELLKEGNDTPNRWDAIRQKRDELYEKSLSALQSFLENLDEVEKRLEPVRCLLNRARALGGLLSKLGDDKKTLEQKDEKTEAMTRQMADIEDLRKQYSDELEKIREEMRARYDKRGCEKYSKLTDEAMARYLELEDQINALNEAAF